MSVESMIWKKKLQMSADQMKKHKAMVRCHSCENYYTDKDGVFKCSKFDKPYADVTFEECKK